MPRLPLNFCTSIFACLLYVVSPSLSNLSLIPFAAVSIACILGSSDVANSPLLIFPTLALDISKLNCPCKPSYAFLLVNSYVLAALEFCNVALVSSNF